jgi:hypothetical protein
MVWYGMEPIDIINKIYEEFPLTPIPNGNDLFIENADDYECDILTPFIIGKNWEMLFNDFNGMSLLESLKYRELTIWLSSKSYAYYLPALLNLGMHRLGESTLLDEDYINPLEPVELSKLSEKELAILSRGLEDCWIDFAPHYNDRFNAIINELTLEQRKTVSYVINAVFIETGWVKCIDNDIHIGASNICRYWLQYLSN